MQFAVAGLIGAAEVLVLEKRSRSLQRLMTTSISRVEILLGHFLAIFTLVLIQFLILITIGDLFFRLTYWQKPMATLLVTMTTCAFIASLGLLIGYLSKTPDHAIIFSLIPMFVLAGLGGAWIPLEFTGKTFQTIGHFTPLAWAMDGFKNIIMRGLGLQSVLLPSLVLFGFAALCFSLAAWRFSKE